MDKLLKEVVEEIVKEELEKIITAESAGGPRNKGGKLQIVKKRKKKLPMHLRTIKPSQAKRIARKSALKRKGKQARISKKAAKTTKKGRSMGLYKK